MARYHSTDSVHVAMRFISSSHFIIGVLEKIFYFKASCYNLDTILGGAPLFVHSSSLLISNRASIKSATATSLQLPVPPESQPEGISLPLTSLRGGGLSCQPKWPPHRVLTTTTFGFSRQWFSFFENWPIYSRNTVRCYVHTQLLK